MDLVHAAVNSVLRFPDCDLFNGVSRHTTTQSIALGVLRDALNAVKIEWKDRVFVGNTDEKITVCVNKNAESPKIDKPNKTSRKRQRNPHEQTAEDAVARAKRSEEGISEKQTQSAVRAIVFMLDHIRGTQNEQAVESWSLTTNRVNDASPKLVLSVRLAPGVAVSLRSLIEMCGNAKDGMLTTNSDMLQKKFNLPLSAEAKATEKHGQKSISVFATLEE